MDDESGNLKKWALGIMSAVVSGVVVYYITEGRSNSPSITISPTPQIIVVQSTPTVTEPKTIVDRGEVDTLVSFMLHDRIFPEHGQLRSETTVYIDGKYVGNLNVDLDNPVTTLSVTVPRPGNYTYYIVDKILNVRPDGGTWVEEAKGGGTINVANGKSFSPVLNSGQATLKETR